MVADVAVRVPGRPSLRIAGRRLQSQPAGVSRVVAGLLVALFVVAGARMVLGAFESSAQYRAAERNANGGPAAFEVYAPDVPDVAGLADRLESVDGVIAAYPQWRVITQCSETAPCLEAFVGQCRDLAAAVPGAVGCRDDRIAWLDTVANRPVGLGATTTWASPASEQLTAPPQGGTVTLDTPRPDQLITSRASEFAVQERIQAQIFIPIGTPGIAELVEATVADTAVPVAVQADPRVLDEQGLRDVVSAITPTSDVYDPWADDSYGFVSGLRALTWVVAGFVLSIGLLGFAVATIDRTVARRAEMVSLQLLGTGRGVIRAAQWWEAAVPLVIGVVIAIGAGSAVGSVYLSIAGGPAGTAWTSIGVLTLVSALAAVAVAGLTVIACAPRIRPELIRRA